MGGGLIKQTFYFAMMVLAACSVDPVDTASVEVVPYTNLPEDTVEIVLYTRAPRITEEMSWKIEWEDGPIKVWSAEVVNDTVTIERYSWCGDECGEVFQLLLVDAHLSLPRFVTCTYTANNFFPEDWTITDSLVAGVVEIQDWDPDGIISGRVQGEWSQGDSLSFIFWVNLAENGD